MATKKKKAKTSEKTEKPAAEKASKKTSKKKASKKSDGDGTSKKPAAEKTKPKRTKPPRELTSLSGKADKLVAKILDIEKTYKEERADLLAKLRAEIGDGPLSFQTNSGPMTLCERDGAVFLREYNPTRKKS